MTPADFLTHFAPLTDTKGGVEKLRNLILQLAVQGKLVEQDPDDEPANELITEVKNVRTKLAEKGVVQEQRKPVPVAEKEFRHKLPKSWVLCRLGDVSEILMGNSPPGNSYNESGIGIPLVNGPVEFSPGPFGMTQKTKFTTAPTKLCEPGDLLVCVRGSTTGRTNIAAFQACIGRGVASIRAYIEQPYVNLFVLAMRQTIFAMGTGSTFPSVSFRHVWGLPIAVPPLAEQRRIVAKVDELMRLCDQLEARQTEQRAVRVRMSQAALEPLTQAADHGQFASAWQRLNTHFDTLFARPESLAQLRQTLLQLAVMGKLVEQDSNDEPAAELLRRAAIEQGKIATSDRRAKRVEPISSHENTHMLPLGWMWERMGNLALFIDYRGRTPPKTDAGIRLITAKNVRFGYVSENPAEYLSKKTYDEWMTRGFPRPGDVLFTTEAPLGNVGVLKIKDTIALAQRVINFRLYSALSPEFLTYCLMSPLMQDSLEKRATGMTAKGIKAAKLKLMPVPVPPLAEQKRIVKRVQELMTLCDTLEAQLARREASAESLLEAMVAAILDGGGKAVAEKPTGRVRAV